MAKKQYSSTVGFRLINLKMNFTSLARVGCKHVRNAMAEGLYLNTGVDTTRPIVIHAFLTERCNSKCRYCDFWRTDNHKEEMSITQWKDALLSLKQFIGPYFIEFSGGEPFMKNGAIDLFRFCQKENISFGITTNGMALGACRQLAAEVVSIKPFNINISIDAPVDQVHDYLRGVTGGLDMATRGIDNVLTECDSQSVDSVIIIKPTVNAKNYHLLPQLVQWAQNKGVSAVNFQPMDRWTPETEDELWIKEDQMFRLEETAEQLIKMKHGGAPIMNSARLLRLWPAHFRDQKAPANVFPCRVGMRNYFIRPDGQVENCWMFKSIGNVNKNNARDIWHGQKGIDVRRKTITCKRLCLYTCLSQKTILDKLKMACTLSHW